MYKDFKKSETLDTGFTSGSSLLWMFSGIVLGLLVGLGMYFFSNDKMPSVSMIDSLEKKIQNAQTAPQKQLDTVAIQKNRPSSLQNNVQNSTSDLAKTTKVEEKKRQNKFSYYAVLPNLDVPIGSAKPINTSQDASSASTQKPNGNIEKSLTDQYTEAVAIQNKNNSETLVEAKKIEATVEETTAQIGDYLLQVASFKKESMADKTRGRLNNKGIDAYIQKKKVKGRYWYRVVAGPVDQVSVDSWKHTAEKLGHRPLIISVR